MLLHACIATQLRSVCRKSQLCLPSTVNMIYADMRVLTQFLYPCDKVHGLHCMHGRRRAVNSTTNSHGPTTCMFCMYLGNPSRMLYLQLKENELSTMPAVVGECAFTEGVAEGESGTGTGCEACEYSDILGEMSCNAVYTLATSIDECTSGGTKCQWTDDSGFGKSISCCAAASGESPAKAPAESPTYPHITIITYFL